MLINDCDYVIVSYVVTDLREGMELEFEIFLSDHTIRKTKLLFDGPILSSYLITLFPSLAETRMIDGFINKSYMIEFERDVEANVNYLIPMYIFKEIFEYTANGVYKECGNGIQHAIKIASTNKVSENAVREYHRNRLLSWLEEFN